MINVRRLTIVSILVLFISVVVVILLLVSKPGQFDAEIADTVEKVVRQDTSFTLVILSDLHYDPSKYNQESGEQDILFPTMNTIGKIRDKLEKRGTTIDAFWNIGDFINGHGTTKEEAVSQIRTVLTAQEKVSPCFHNIMGNHDNNIYATWSDPPLPTTEVLSVYELNNLLSNSSYAQCEVHNEQRVTDYYVDFEKQGIRVVCLSADYTSFKQSTVDWLRTEALATEKSVFFLSHVPTRPEWGFKEDVEGGEGIEEAIKEFIFSGGVVIAFIHGHDHGDIINTVTTDDGKVLWSEVAIGCARFQEPKSNGTPGMTFWPRNAEDETALLFDIVCIDQESKTVKFIRFGAGEDREIRYE